MGQGGYELRETNWGKFSKVCVIRFLSQGPSILEGRTSLPPGMEGTSHKGHAPYFKAEGQGKGRWSFLHFRVLRILLLKTFNMWRHHILGQQILNPIKLIRIQESWCTQDYSKWFREMCTAFSSNHRTHVSNDSPLVITITTFLIPCALNLDGYRL